jgi:hypothetical protein
MRCAALSVVFAGCALLTACGGSGGASPSATTPSSTLGTLTTQNFSTIIPRAWTNETSNQSAVARINASGTMQMLLFAPTTTTDEHIDVTVAAQPVPDDQVASYLQSVSQNGATNLSQPQPFAIDGATGVYITYEVMTKTGGTNQEQDMIVNHGGNTFDIVLNAAQTRFNLLLPGLQQVLSAWKWTV